MCNHVFCVRINMPLTVAKADAQMWDEQQHFSYEH
jgi:hypothetical protein